MGLIDDRRIEVIFDYNDVCDGWFGCKMNRFNRAGAVEMLPPSGCLEGNVYW